MLGDAALAVNSTNTSNAETWMYSPAGSHLHPQQYSFHSGATREGCPTKHFDASILENDVPLRTDVPLVEDLAKRPGQEHDVSMPETGKQPGDGVAVVPAGRPDYGVLLANHLSS